MSILLVVTDRPMAPTADAIQRLAPEVRVQCWPSVRAPEEVRLAVVWKHPAEAFDGLCNLQGVLSYGAGSDHLAACPPPQGVLLGRTVPSSLTDDVAEYVLAVALAHKRRLWFYSRQQRWETQAAAEAPVVREATLPVACVLGLGAVGMAVATRLQAAAFEVRGVSRRTRKGLPFQVYCGDAGLQEAVAGADYLVSALPLNGQTEGLLERGLFNRLRRGAYLINVGRGAQLNEPHLLAAIESGRLAGAALDVTTQEPLPREHPFWSVPEILVTPHIAGITRPEDAAAAILRDYRALLAGDDFTNPVADAGPTTSP